MFSSAGTFCSMVSRKSAKFAGAMPAAMQLAQHVAAGHVESGEQAGGTVALVVVAATFHLSEAHGQQGCGAVQRLNLALSRPRTAPGRGRAG